MAQSLAGAQTSSLQPSKKVTERDYRHDCIDAHLVSLVAPFASSTATVVHLPHSPAVGRCEKITRS